MAFGAPHRDPFLQVSEQYSEARICMDIHILFCDRRPSPWNTAGRVLAEVAYNFGVCPSTGYIQAQGYHIFWGISGFIG
jgi:hypothetical protein